MGRGICEERGSEVGNPPVAPLVEVAVRGGRGGEGGSVKEKRMKQEMEGRTVVQEFPVLVESQEEELEGKRKR